MHRRVGRVELAFTDRAGGHSHGAWSSLNLGTSNGDDPTTVQRNLDELAAAMEVDRLVRMTQVHGRDVHVATGEDDMLASVPVADALVTETPGLGLLVRVADCAPVVVADTERGIVAVVHVGRKGLVAEVARQAVGRLHALGATDLAAWIGPRACGRCYELPQDMADEVAADIPAARSTTSWGTPAIDIGAGLRSQLADLDVTVHDIGSDLCTIEDEQFFSYRRQGQDSGRFGAVVVVR
ncbi:peptidoglycan editing factor PgeF [soil metagenome]